MADVNVNFIHPTDGRVLNVSLDDSVTAQEAIAELIAAEFIRPDPQGYKLAIQGGIELAYNQSFADAEVKNDNKVRVLPAMDAGNF